MKAINWQINLHNHWKTIATLINIILNIGVLKSIALERCYLERTLGIYKLVQQKTETTHG